MAGRRPRRLSDEISKPKSPAERQEQILAATRALIEEQGLAYVTMERVANKAKVSKPVVYGQFKNRGALLVALLEQFYDEIDRQLTPEKPASPDLDVFTSELITAYFDALERGGPALYAVAGSGAEEPEVNQARLARFERIEHIWSAKYTKALGLAPDTAAAAAATLRSAIAGAGAFWMEHQEATRELCVNVCTSIVSGALSELKELAG